MRGLGVRITERMAGYLTLSGRKVPFDININAFCGRTGYPLGFEFKGTAALPGTLTACPVIEGKMGLSHKGVSYDFELELPDLGVVRVTGSKRYRYLASPGTIRSSLVTLPLNVFKDGAAVGEGMLAYLPPLYHFPFGVSLCSRRTAFEPRLCTSEALIGLLPIFVPDTKADARLVREQVNRMSPALYALLRLSVLTVKVLSMAMDKSALAKFLAKSRCLYALTFPAAMVLMSGVYEEKENTATQAVREPERWMDLCFTPGQLEEKEIEVDVVIVGSGAGGAAMAFELARKGHAVAVVEEGHYFKRPDMTARRSEMMAKLYRRGGESFALSNALIWLPTGKCVGGTTTINSGTVMRTPERVLHKWEKELGVPAADFHRAFPQVEEMLRSRKVPKELRGSIEEVLKAGSERLGLSPHPLARAEEGCDGQGCCVLGCPSGAKRSTDVSYMAEAMKNNAYLFSHYKADEVLIENGRAAGVAVSLEGYGDQFKLKIRSRKVVLAAGTLGTPLLLKKIKGPAGNPHLGRHLTIHPAINVGAKFKHNVRDRNYVPQSMAIFPPGEDRWTLEGYTLPAEALPLAFPVYGQDAKEMMEDSGHITNFAALLSDCSEGRIIFAGGRALPYYPATIELRGRLSEAAAMIAEIFFEAGAKEVYLPIGGLEKVENKNRLSVLRREVLPGRYYSFSAFHPLGTCRMGTSSENSVVDPWGRVWGVKDLYVADGSVLPGPLGVNPQVTIMANSLRIAAELEKTL